MNPERWQKVKEILDAALDLDPEERAGFVAQACEGEPEVEGEVVSLLKSHGDAGDFLENTPHSLDITLAESGPADLRIGRVIGAYRLEQLLGQGGMGAVYRAVRDDGEFHMQVAIKVVRHSMISEFLLRRFRIERQILARLNHPNIARLLDGGITRDGVPYLVMEYVEGVPIHTYCRMRQLTTGARIRLFQKVCDAVHYAHQNLIVHSDIKPGNVLVTANGEPKLLDFGIAKLLDPDFSGGMTVTIGVRPMTPAYASPEQLRGEAITTASDVYSLGVFLYELLTEKRPYEIDTASVDEVLRLISSKDPARPSVAAAGQRRLDADLDNIVLKAMHREPGRRYQSAEQLSADLQRHLDGNPVLARPDSLSYRAAKFARRHRSLAVAAAVVLITLVGGIAATLREASIANRERLRAERRFEEMRKMANSIIFDLDERLATLPGTVEVRSLLLRRSLEYLDSMSQESAGDEKLQRELAMAYVHMGDVQGHPRMANVGSTSDALNSYRKALAIYEQISAAHQHEPEYQQELANIYVRMANVLKVAGDYAGGMEMDGKALSIRERMLAKEPANRDYRRLVASSFTDLGGSYSQLGDWDNVEKYRQKALAMFEELVRDEDATMEDRAGLATAYARMGSILTYKGELSEGLTYYRKAIEYQTGILQINPANSLARSRLGVYRNGYAIALAKAGYYQAALGEHDAATRILEEIAKSDQKDARARSLLATAYTRTAETLIQAGKPAAAIEPLRKALEMRRVLSNENPMNAGAEGEVAESCLALADATLALGRRAEALRWYKEARDILGQLRREHRSNAVSDAMYERASKQLERLETAVSPKRPTDELNARR
jgi:tetratricopeptide (TPR) repeat protein/tRNA A-37 threonylcarbamoyl transferase component Bud32